MKSFTLTLRLAARNLVRQGRRTLSTLTAIVIGLVGLSFLDGFVSYSLWGLRETVVHSGTGHLQIASSARYFDEGDTDPTPFLLPNATALAKTLRHNPAVKAVLPSLNFSAVLQTGSLTQNARVQAYPTAQRRENLNFLTLKAGAELEPGVRGSLLLGVGLAKLLNVQPGSTLTLFAVGSDGSLANRSFRVSGLVTTRIADFDRALVITDLADAQELLGTDQVPLLTVFLEHGDDTPKLAAQWRRSPPWGASSALVVRTWDQLSPYYEQASGSYLMVLGVAGFIVLIVVLFSIAGTLNLSVLERSRELGTLRALGTRRSRITQILVVEGLLLGLGGAVVGTLLGWGLTAAVNAAGGLAMGIPPGMSEPLTILFRSDPSHALKSALWVVIAALIGAWFPGWFASRRDPAVLLRTE